MLGKLTTARMAALAVPYGFVLASLYLYAYWHPLGLNPFQYANAADLVSATIGGAMLAFLGVAAGILLGLVGSDIPRSSWLDRLSLIWRQRILFAGALLAGVVFAAFRSPFCWAWWGVSAMFFLAWRLRDNEAFLRQLPSPYARTICIGLLTMVPALIYANGVREVQRALSPRQGMEVDLARTTTHAKLAGRVMYAGMLGDFHILRETGTRTTVLVPADREVVLKSRGSANPFLNE